jgi:hypothetical protein
VTASREAARAVVAVRVAENLRRKAEAQLAAAEISLDSTLPVETQQATDAKAKAIVTP